MCVCVCAERDRESALSVRARVWSSRTLLRLRANAGRGLADDWTARVSSVCMCVSVYVCASACAHHDHHIKSRVSAAAFSMCNIHTQPRTHQQTCTGTATHTDRHLASWCTRSSVNNLFVQSVSTRAINHTPHTVAHIAQCYLHRLLYMVALYNVAFVCVTIHMY